MAISTPAKQSTGASVLSLLGHSDTGRRCRIHGYIRGGAFFGGRDSGQFQEGDIQAAHAGSLVRGPYPCSRSRRMADSGKWRKVSDLSWQIVALTWGVELRGCRSNYFPVPVPRK